jgi:hypothetical protein
MVYGRRDVTERAIEVYSLDGNAAGSARRIFKGESVSLYLLPPLQPNTLLYLSLSLCKYSIARLFSHACRAIRMSTRVEPIQDFSLCRYTQHRGSDVYHPQYF